MPIKPSIFDERRAELDKKEPWSKVEKSAYQERDRNFIRDIQIKDNISKNQAKRKFIKYLHSSDESKRKINSLRNQVRDMLKKGSPPTHSPPIPISSHKFIRPEVKLSKTPKSPVEYINTTKSPKVKERLISAHKKYPTASTFELRYGVNSKKSQEYRERHGLNREFINPSIS